MWFSNNLVEPRESKISTELFNNWLFKYNINFCIPILGVFQKDSCLSSSRRELYYVTVTVINQDHLKSIMFSTKRPRPRDQTIELTEIDNFSVGVPKKYYPFKRSVSVFCF